MKKFLLLLLISPFCFACSKDDDGNEDFEPASVKGTIWTGIDNETPIMLNFHQDTLCMVILEQSKHLDTLYYFYKFEKPKLFFTANENMNLFLRPDFDGLITKGKIIATFENGESVVFNLKK